MNATVVLSTNSVPTAPAMPTTPPATPSTNVSTSVCWMARTTTRWPGVPAELIGRVRDRRLGAVGDLGVVDDAGDAARAAGPGDDDGVDVEDVDGDDRQAADGRRAEDTCRRVERRHLGAGAVATGPHGRVLDRGADAVGDEVDDGRTGGADEGAGAGPREAVDPVEAEAVDEGVDERRVVGVDLGRVDGGVGPVERRHHDDVLVGGDVGTVAQLGLDHVGEIVDDGRAGQGEAGRAGTADGDGHDPRVEVGSHEHAGLARRDRGRVDVGPDLALDRVVGGGGADGGTTGTGPGSGDRQDLRGLGRGRARRSGRP